MSVKQRWFPPNLIYSFDFGSTSLKWCQAILSETQDFQIIREDRFEYPQVLHKKTFDFKFFEDFLVRGFRRLEDPYLAMSDKKAMVTLPLSYYKIECVRIQEVLSGERITQDHKIDLINKAKDRHRNGVILHTIPKAFYVNDKKVDDPLGCLADEFAMEICLIYYNEYIFEQIRNILRQLGFSVGKYVAPPLSFINYFFNRTPERDQIKPTLIIDLGGQVSYVYDLKEGYLQNFYCYPHGGDLVTSDLVHVLEVPAPDAMRIKEFINLKPGSGDDKIKVRDKDLDPKLARDVVAARYDEWLDYLIKQSGALDDPAEYQIILLGAGHPKGAAEFIESKWKTQLPKLSVVEQKKTMIYCFGNLHYALNNEIYIPQVPPGRSSLFKRLRAVFEDLF